MYYKGGGSKLRNHTTQVQKRARKYIYFECGASFARFLKGILSVCDSLALVCMRSLPLIILMLLPTLLPAQDGGGSLALPEDHLTTGDYARIHADLANQTRLLTQQGLLLQKNEVVSLGWPIRMAAHLSDPALYGISNFVDQDQTTGIRDFNCGSRTYDGHNGTDIFLWPFQWLMMDQNSVEVVAAAPGVILQKVDGNYDRRCDWTTDPNWNAVFIRHSDGSTTWYGHLKRGSLTSKAIGQSVAQGEYLGLVGSSGKSTGPHLHFEVYDPAGKLIDPYAGSCNSLNASSWWSGNKTYYDSGINALRLHSKPPVFNTCPTPESTFDKTIFAPGSQLITAAYFRDQQVGQNVSYRLIQPNGSTWLSWSQTMNTYYPASYWYWTYSLPTSPTGMWRFEATYQGKTVFKAFTLSAIASTDDEIPDQSYVSALYPSPFTSKTSLDLHLNKPQKVSAVLYNTLGQSIKTVFEGVVPATGMVHWTIDTSDLARGVYFVRVQGEDFAITRSAVK